MDYIIECLRKFDKTTIQLFVSIKTMCYKAVKTMWYKAIKNKKIINGTHMLSK